MAIANWLKDVIDNGEYKDDMVISLAGGQTVPLGDIRNLTKANQKLLADREANVMAQESQLKKNLETLQLAQAETAKLYTDLQNQKVSKRDNDIKDDPFESMERDPILGPIAKAIRQQAATMEDFKIKALQPIVKAQQDMAAAYVSNRIEDMYDRVVPDGKKDKLTLESVLKVANDNKYTDRYGVPDIRRAYQHISTKPITQDDLDSQLKAAEDKGRKEATDAARLRVPRPGIGSVSGRPESAFKATKLTSVGDALSEALAAAAKDPDIWANIDGQVQ